MRRHRYDLRARKHGNDYLQKAWNKYGEPNFIFIIVEKVNPTLLLQAEQKYLDIAKSEQFRSYNLTFGAERREHTKRSKDLISRALTGIKRDIGFRQKCRENKLGKNNPGFGKPQNTNIYTFQNEKSGEIFTGTCLAFRQKFNIEWIRLLVVPKPRHRTCHGWFLL